MILTIFFIKFFQAIWPYSGHYLPTEENFKEFISFLEEHNVDLTNVKVLFFPLFSFEYMQWLLSYRRDDPHKR